MSTLRGQWIVCVRDIQAGEDDYLGPFTVEARAVAVADRLNRDIAARGASHMLDAIVEWVQPGAEIEDYRDKMLADLEDGGYAFVPVEVRAGVGFNPDVGF